MIEAVGWGALAASSLLIGAVARLRPPLAPPAGRHHPRVRRRRADQRGQLRARPGGSRGRQPQSTAIGLGVGAITYFLADGYIAKRFSGGRGRRGREDADDSGTALALGAFLDGIPEQLVLGIGLAAGEGVGVGLLVAIFVSNLPEAIGSASAMRDERPGPVPDPRDSGRSSQRSA